MKLAIFSMVAIGCLIAVVSSADEDYDYEEEPAASPVTPAPTKSSRLGGLLSSRGRVNVGRKPAATAASTTAKAIEQPAETEEEGEEELDENQEQQEEVLTTTTEASKKVRSGVRPFRSNQDLLAALKRRRSQVGTSNHRESTQTAAESTTPKSKATTNNRNKSIGASDTKSSGRGRFGGRGSKPLQEEVEETQREEVQVKPKPYRRG
ncbi:helicase SWR1 isoform X2 [Ceratina calcarata]|uniref:Helicase SWR1 isoform X2 n=1 Tax=Ceratina calcarata TaxID=156304 RepID=A0AAJ7JAH1_9HYME|nr:helicase SWR1 isoform X2 [Ceratina calcarata]